VPLTELQVKYPASIPLPERIEGDGVALAPWRLDDAPALFDAVHESIDRIDRWLPWADRHPCVEATRQWLATCIASWTTRENFTLAMWDRAGSSLLGGAGLHPQGTVGRIDWTLRAFEIGYWVRTQAEGRGHVAEAVRLLTRWAFDDLDANRVVIRCDPRNERSWRVAERAGYALEGTAKSVLRWSDGEIRDLRVYARVRGSIPP
jgi:ribosomal-protein-serine acetyltransferase